MSGRRMWIVLYGINHDADVFAGEEVFTYMEDGNLMKFDAVSNTSSLFVPKSIFVSSCSITYIFPTNENHAFY